MRNRLGIWLGLALGGMCGVTQAEYLTNGAFEEYENGRLVGWKLSHPALQAGRGYGHNGSGGLYWHSDIPSTVQVSATQVLDVKRGQAYAFSMLARSEDFVCVKNGAAICVEWYDAQDRWMAGGYIKGVTARNQDWTLIRGVTRDLPADAAKVVVNVYFGKGFSGKAWIDNVVIEPLVRRPVDFVFSSAYRDVAAEGKVRFHASLYRPEGASNTHARFTYVDAANTTRHVSATREDASGATLELDLAVLKLGKQDVICELVAADGKVLGSAACDFERVSHLPARRVWIDAHRRCIVDGKPFFPLGMYSGFLRGEQFETYARGPFTVALPYPRVTKEDLDRFQSRGLMGFCSIRDGMLDTKWAKEKGVTTVAAADAYLKGEIDKVKDHPALLGWYVMDESPATEIPEHSRIYESFKRFDPDHPTFAVMDRTYDLREFIPTFDVLGMDPYPVAQKPLRHVTDMMREVNRLMFYDRPLWDVPQAFDWGWFRKDQKDRERFPTEQEIRNMAFQHIAHGANGLITYCYHSLYRDLEDKSRFDDLWGRICRAHADVKKMIPVMLSVEEAPAVTGATDEILTRTWSHAGALYVLVVNVADAPRTAQLSIAGAPWSRATAEVGGDARLSLAANRLSVALPPIGVAFVKLVK